MSRKIIVGDIHGCLPELQDLLEVVSLRPDDELISAGDVVDRGPDSAGVVRFLRELGETQRVTLVRGNHEQKHLNQKFKGDKDRAVHATLLPEDIEFLRNAKLYRKLPQHGAIVVHGGIPVGLQVLPASFAELRALPSRDRKRVSQVMYTVHVESEGERLFWPWAYDGRFGHVYYGHRATRHTSPIQHPHSTGLDLGCVYGGRLCCAILEEGEETQYASVPAHKEYAKLRKECSS